MRPGCAAGAMPINGYHYKMKYKKVRILLSNLLPVCLAHTRYGNE